MAGKEATVYILDLGRSMGEKRHDRDQTDLDWALEYVWDKITNTVSRRSFGDLVRIIQWDGEIWDEQFAKTVVMVWIIVVSRADFRVGCDRTEKRAYERYWMPYG